MGAAPHFHGRGGRRLGARVGDDQGVLDGGPQGRVRPAGHGAGGLADGGDPHGRAEGGGLGLERRAHAAGALDALEGRLEEPEQQRAPRVGAFRQFSSREPL